MLQIFLLREDKNIGAVSIIGQIKTTSVLGRPVFVYFGTGKGKEVEYLEIANVTMQGKLLENQKEK